MSTNSGIQKFDYTVDVGQAILWQYDNAPNLKDLVFGKQFWYLVYQTGFWSQWYTDVFNLNTANLFGLSLWSFILDLPLLVELNPDDLTKPLWGFNAYTSPWPTPVLENGYFNFCPTPGARGNFSSRTGALVLTTAEQRLVLQIRAYQITSSGDVWDVNNFFQYLFANSPDYAGHTINMIDNLDMTVTYVFTGTFSYGLQSMFAQYDVLPRPAGVGIIYSYL